MYHLVVCGEAIAKANGSQVIEPFDLPITKGLQENIRAFEQLDEDIALAPFLAHLTALPPLSLIYSDETEAQLPSIAGGLSVALAHTLKIIDPKLKNPQTEHWQRSFRIFDLIV